MFQRYLQAPVREDLGSKMVFLVGPRQVGKTTLAKEIMKEAPNGRYYLWDDRRDRKELLRAQWPPDPTTIVLDELHKYRKWKQWIKAQYDKHKDSLRFLVTGSARMDVYRRGGDSLQGRYHHYRLHPISVVEIGKNAFKQNPFSPLQFPQEMGADLLEGLLNFSGFPEPWIAQSERIHRRWQKERLERFFREDVRDLEHIQDLSSMQLLAEMLPARVGSVLSLNSLREDLDVSHKAVTRWVDILERLYYVFRIRPYSARPIRGLKKEPKAYLWDWTLVNDDGDRYENLVASHLLKFCHYLEDTEGYQIELHYLRDVAKREVDFLVTVDRKPWFAVEAKLTETVPARPLRYFGERLKIPFLYQVVLNTDRDFVEEGLRVLPAAKFLGALV